MIANELNQQRMESLKILIHDAMTKSDSNGKLTLLVDIWHRRPVGITDSEVETVFDELEKKEFAKVEGTGVRTRLMPLPRFSIWHREFGQPNKQNLIYVENMINSQIQQGTINSTQIVKFNAAQNNVFVDLVKN